MHSKPSHLLHASTTPPTAHATLSRNQGCYLLLLLPPLAQVLTAALSFALPTHLQQLGLDPTDYAHSATRDVTRIHLTRAYQEMTSGGFLYGSFLLALTLTKAAFQALAVVYPSYKTYKALESRSLQAAQSMLLYWCITAFIASAKEVVDQIFGTYSNFFLWKLTVLGLKVAPLIVGPERMYNLIVKPLYDANEQTVDAVVSEAHKVKSIATEAAPAVKAGDVEGIKEAATEVLGVMSEAGTGLIGNVKSELVELRDVMQHKSEAMGVAWNKEGLLGVLEKIVGHFEVVREAVVEQSDVAWQQHGPLIRQKSSLAYNKSAELYSTHAPVIKQKALDTYTTTIRPKLQPTVDKLTTQYNETLLPFASAKKEQAFGLWEKHGAPVRSFYASKWQPLYHNTLLPMYTDKIRPFVRDCFLPAVWETLLALKDRVMDFINEPSDSIKSQRAEHKKHRAAAREARANASWKKRGNKINKKFERSWKELEQVPENELVPAPTTAVVQPSAPIESAPITAPSATLVNRVSGEQRDSSISADVAAPRSNSNNQSDWVKTSTDLPPISERLHAVPLSKDGAIQQKTSPPTAGAFDKENTWATEPRSERLPEPIQ